MKDQTIPDDFPRDPIAASIGGFQAKVLLRNVGGKYIAGQTEDELRERYEACLHSVVQLAAYCQRKAAENPEWTHEFNLDRTRRGLANKTNQGLWNISLAEQGWIMSKVKDMLGW